MATTHGGVWDRRCDGLLRPLARAGCWHEGYPYYDYPVPPRAGPRGRWREYARKDERADLEGYLDHLEAELQHIRDRLEELQNADPPKG